MSVFSGTLCLWRYTTDAIVGLAPLAPAAGFAQAPTSQQTVLIKVITEYCLNIALFPVLRSDSRKPYGTVAPIVVVASPTIH